MSENKSEKRETPELRFVGFTDPWEQRKLGELGTTYSGLSGKTKEDFGHGAASFVPYTNVFDNPVADTGRLEKVEIDSRQNEVRRGDALFTVSSETPEEVGMSSVWLSDKPNVYLNSFCFGYRQNGSFDSRYLAYMLRSATMRFQLTMLAQGISRFNISKHKVMGLDVPLPSLPEQQAIGSLFSRLDSLITLHQRKHDMLAKIKKSLLERMFPKEGETVPELRFAGFTDPWEQRKLGEIASFAKGVGYSKADVREDGTPLFLYGRMYTQYEANVESVDTYTEPKAGSLYSKGNELVVPASGESAEDIARASAITTSGILLGGDLNVIYPGKQIVPLFLAYGMSQGTNQKLLAQRAQGKTVVHIHASDLAALAVAIPSAAEQQAIGSFFSRLDSLITLHQRKLDLLKNVKKSLLEKMFV